MPHGYCLMVKGKNEETQGHQVSHDDSAECFSGTLSHKFGFSCSKGFSAYQSRRSASVVRLHPEKRNVLMWVPGQSAIAGALPEKPRSMMVTNQKQSNSNRT